MRVTHTMRDGCVTPCLSLSVCMFRLGLIILGKVRGNPAAALNLFPHGLEEGGDQTDGKCRSLDGCCLPLPRFWVRQMGAEEKQSGADATAEKRQDGKNQ